MIYHQFLQTLNATVSSSLDYYTIMYKTNWILMPLLQDITRKTAVAITLRIRQAVSELVSDKLLKF
jgi:hypothetical protein